MLGFSVFLIVAIAFVTAVLGRGATQSALAESSAKYALAHWMEELARIPGPFRTRIGRHFASRRADDLAVTWVEARRRHYRVVLRQLVGSLVLQAVAGTAVLGLGGVLVVSGQLTMGQLVASEIIVATIVAGVARLGKLLESYYDLLAALDKFGVLLDLPLERSEGVAPPSGDGPAELELRAVVVKDASGAAASKPIRARIAAGERVAIRGDDGLARRRLLEAICGMREPSSGIVLVDGENLASVHLESMRDAVGLVREPELYQGTLIDNLRLACPDASQRHIESVLERIGLQPAIDRLSDGLATHLRLSGSPLDPSGRRLLALARTVIAGPRLLCVDEEVLGLDSEEREHVLDVLLDPEAPWTLVISTHCTDWLPEDVRVIDLDGDEPTGPRPVETETRVGVVRAVGEEEQTAR
jgi:ABC-type bacteriocin/lantibiotic exporter with double-glycine peptidase domain